jgi:hypothetical protein
VPRLLGQEKFIFDELVSYVWTHTLVPKVAVARARAPPGPAGNKRGAHEAALRKWLEALEAANNQLRGLGAVGHINMLRQQVRAWGRCGGRRSKPRPVLLALLRALCRAGRACLAHLPAAAITLPPTPPPRPTPTPPPPQVLLELLKRIDALLFHYLVNPDASAGGPGSEAGASDDHYGPVMDARNPNMPVLDDSMLFFARGALTFGTGMQLKMACTRCGSLGVGVRARRAAGGFAPACRPAP